MYATQEARRYTRKRWSERVRKRDNIIESETCTCVLFVSGTKGLVHHEHIIDSPIRTRVCNEFQFRFQVQRLAEYERYLGQEARNLAAESGNNGGGGSSGAVLQRGQLEGDLHRIQELFPNDNLRLHEQDVLTTVILELCYNI